MEWIYRMHNAGNPATELAKNKTVTTSAAGANSTREPLMWGNRVYPHSGEHWKTGNRCGHDPKKPRSSLFGKTKSKRLTPTQQKFMDAIRRYYDSPLMLPSLACLPDRAWSRSEGRESEMRVMLAVMANLDFATWQVGTPNADGSFYHMTFGQLAQSVGMEHPDSDPEHPRPNEAFRRAVERLKLACAFDTVERKELTAGGWRSRAAIKTVNRDFVLCFEAVSSAALANLEQYAQDQQAKREAKWNKNNPIQAEARSARVRVQLKQGTKKAARTIRKAAAKNVKRTTAGSWHARIREINARRNAETVALHRDFPGQSLGWYSQQVANRHPYPDKPPEPRLISESLNNIDDLLDF